MNIGQMIKEKLYEDGHSVTWLAKRLCCTRTNIYKIFSKENLDADLLWKISIALKYDFFREYSRKLQEKEVYPNNKLISTDNKTDTKM